MLKLKGFPSVEEVQKAESEGTPLVIAPSVSARCNYECIMCYVPSGKAPEGEVGLAEHMSVIDQTSKLGAKYMIIAMVGEPFMDLAFFDRQSASFPMIDYANEQGIYVVTFTNGSLVTPETADQLKRKDVSLIGKLWSLNPEIDDELTGKQKRWVEYDGEHIPAGLKFMIDAGFNEVHGDETRLGIDVIVTARNYQEIPRIAEYAIAHGIKPIIDTMIPTERAQQNYQRLRLTEEQNRWLYSELVRILGEDFITDQFVEGCATRRVGLAYDNFGNVKVCCALGSDVGNIGETPVKDLHKRIQEYRGKLPHFERTVGTLNACDIARLVKQQRGMD